MAAALKKAIGALVAQALSQREPEKVRDKKVIHDSIHGSNLFEKYEIAILDLPLLQRLRKISQVDLVPLVFPSGNHNRFEHTLGVTVVAERLARAIQKRYPNLISESDIRRLRLAAILHDCGHGPFSHMSDELMDRCRDLAEVKREEGLQEKAAHEVL